MRRIYGSPSIKAAALLKSRSDFLTALRENDQKALHSIPPSDGQGISFLDFSGGIRTNHFEGLSSYIEAGTKKVWALARATDLKANVVLSTDTYLSHRDPAKKKSGAVVRPDPDLVRILQNPNPYDTASEAMYLWVWHMNLTGNSFWLKDDINRLGQPKNCFPLYPQRVEIVKDKSAKIAKYSYRINGGVVDFAPEEIIHWKRPHAGGSLFGLGEVEQGESLFDDFINRSLFNVRNMENGGIPTGVLVKDSDSEDQKDWDRMKAKVRDEIGGVKNTGRFAMINGKWTFLQLGLDAQKMQHLEKHIRNVEEIFINSGVPLSVAGFGAANYATAKQDDINFRKYGCLPLLNIFTDRLNAPGGLIPAFHKELKFDFSLQGLVDVEQVTKEYGPLVELGVMKPKELREKAGLPIDNDPMLDRYYIKQNLVPLELSGIADEGSLAGDNNQVDTSDAPPAKKPREERRAA